MMVPTMSSESTLLPQEEPAALVHFLRRIALASAWVTLAIMGAIFLTQPQEPLRLGAPFALLLVLLWSYWLAARRLRKAAAVMVVGLWLVTTASVLMFAGVYSVNLLVYPYVIVLAGWLLGRRWVWAVTLGTSAVLLAVAGAQMAGVFTPTARVGPVTHLASTLPLLWVIAFLTITGRKLLQRSRRKSEEFAHQLQGQLHAVRLREEELALLMDTAPVGIVSHDRQRRVLRCNAHYAAYFGRSPKALEGLRLEEFASPQVLEIVQPLFDGLVQGKSFSRRLGFPALDGTGLLWTDVRAVPRMSDGVMTEALVVLLDVSPAVRAEEAVRSLNAELSDLLHKRTQDLERTQNHLDQSREELLRSEARATLSTLVAGVSHELGSPIGNSVLVASTLVERAQSLQAQVDSGKVSRSALVADLREVRESSDMLLRNLRRSQQLLLQFKQVSADQASEQRRRFDLHEVVDDTVASMQPTLRLQGHTVRVEVPLGIEMDSYPGAVGQVVINLVQNACLHAFAASQVGEVHIKAMQAGDSVALEVADNGRGMAPDEAQRAFEPFFSTKLGQGGTGLGLSIVHHLAQKTLGGRVSLHSAPQQGTCVALVLPRVAPA